MTGACHIGYFPIHISYVTYNLIPHFSKLAQLLIKNENDENIYIQTIKKCTVLFDFAAVR